VAVVSESDGHDRLHVRGSVTRGNDSHDDPTDRDATMVVQDQVEPGKALKPGRAPDAPLGGRAHFAASPRVPPTRAAHDRCEPSCTPRAGKPVTSAASRCRAAERPCPRTEASATRAARSKLQVKPRSFANPHVNARSCLWMQAVVQWNVTPNRPASDGDPHRPNARTGFPIAHACAWTGGTSRIWLTPYRKQMMRTLQGSARARSRRH